MVRTSPTASPFSLVTTFNLCFYLNLCFLKLVLILFIREIYCRNLEYILMKKSAQPKSEDFYPTFVESEKKSRILGKKSKGQSQGGKSFGHPQARLWTLLLFEFSLTAHGYFPGRLTNAMLGYRCDILTYSSDGSSLNAEYHFSSCKHRYMYLVRY